MKVDLVEVQRRVVLRVMIFWTKFPDIFFLANYEIESQTRGGTLSAHGSNQTHRWVMVGLHYSF